jgi:hypothetical protein
MDIVKLSRLLQIARNQIGVKEDTGNNDGEPVKRYAGGRSEPWCAHFVAWVLRNAGLKIPDDVIPTEKQANPLASVSHMEKIFKDHEWFYRQPMPGDIVFFASRGQSDVGRGRHCGIVEMVDSKTFSTIEGNLSNAVRRKTHSLDNPQVTGFGRLP